MTISARWLIFSYPTLTQPVRALLSTGKSKIYFTWHYAFVKNSLFFAKIRLPEIITGTLSSVGAMIGPASMFVIGMLIGGMDLKKVLTNKKAYFISFMRLIVIPLIALLILKVSGLVGWNKEGEEILLIVFMAVISPVASTVTQMCQVYDNDSRYASTISVLTTLGAIVTMPLMVLVFQMVM